MVAEGPVGLTWLGRSRFFRYEIRRWRDGAIPDIAEAVDSPRNLDTDAGRACRRLDLVPDFPAVTWGRDELRAGEMWNSNSLISWLLVRSDHQACPIRPPACGRAPGWAAGADRGGQGYTGNISYSSMRNHDPSAPAISFR